MIDWHCHILPGLDDGARSLSEALEMARILSANGFVEVYCTPHAIRGLYDNTPGQVRRAVAELQAAIDSAGIALRLHPGMEYFLDEYFTRQMADPLPLGESNRLLVESSPHADPEQVKEQLFAIRRRGLTPLLAHPERYGYITARQPRVSQGLLARLKGRFAPVAKPQSPSGSFWGDLHDMGCFLQGNLGSLAGVYGSEVKVFAQHLLTESAYYCFGSDAHKAEALEKILSRGLAILRGEVSS